jgi:hypothetical protein
VEGKQQYDENNMEISGENNMAFTGKSWRLNNLWQMSKHQEYGDIVNKCSNPLAIGFFDDP